MYLLDVFSIYFRKHCSNIFLLYAVFKVQLTVNTVDGDKGIRTLDPLLARQVLSQLSYTPMDISCDILYEIIHNKWA